MTRSDLISRLAERNPALTAGEFDRIVSAITEAISQQLIAGGKVELRGFGSFSTRAREGRVGRNPKTGEAVNVSPKRAVHFKPGKDLRQMGIHIYNKDLDSSARPDAVYRLD